MSTMLEYGDEFTYWATIDGVWSNLDATVQCDDGVNTSFTYYCPLACKVRWKVLPTKVIKTYIREGK